MAYSVKLLNKLPEGRQRVLLLISETRDHGSHLAMLDDVVKLIGVTNTAVYSDGPRGHAEEHSKAIAT